MVDRFDSGLGIAALTRADLDSKIHVIAALDFPSSAILLQFLIDGNYKSVLFSWRYLLLELKRDFFLKKSMNLLKLTMDIGVLIPDYQGVNLERMVLEKNEIEVLEYADFFCVTNSNLEKIYSSLYPSHKFSGIYHDLPSLSNIRLIRSMGIEADPNKIIWVGNSKWGSRHGYIDHKGLSRIVEPLQEVLRSRSSSYYLEVIDSANFKLDNPTVLQKIAESSFLILCSEHEGTGLPILEAIGLGAKVITTKVGIAPELFHHSGVLAIAENSAESFYEILQSGSLDAPRERVISVFESYVLRVSEERIIPIRSDQFACRSRYYSVWRIPLLRIKWYLRYLKNLN